MSAAREITRKLTIALNNITGAYYSDTAKGSVRESEFWMLYALDSDTCNSQKQLCEEWGFSKTTVNTTIKQAEAAGYLTLTPIPGKRREMNICLTDSGKAHAARVLDTIHKAEDTAMRETKKRYSAEFIDALDYFSTCLKAALERNPKEMENKN